MDTLNDGLSVFREFLTSCTSAQKRAVLLLVTDSIKQDSMAASRSPISNFSDCVEVIHDFLPATFLDEAVYAEVESMGLDMNSKQPQSQWLSNDDRDYCFSENQKLRHPAKSLLDYPAIRKVVEEVNKEPLTTRDGDSTLVILYDAETGIGFHNDGEALIDNNSSISTLIFGGSRDVQFCQSSQWPRVPQHTVTCGHHDLMVMKPGCQDQLVHRVCRGDGTTKAPPSLTSVMGTNWRVAVSVRKTADREPPSPGNVTEPEESIPKPGITHGHRVKQVRVSLIAGDSHTLALDADKLGRKGRKTVFNLSQKGARIPDVRKQVEQFYLTEDLASGRMVVDKVFLSVGTNDIRECRKEGTRGLKAPLTYLVEQVKLLYPDAVIWIQSLVPLPWQHNFTFQNVLQCNQVIFEVCKDTHCFYLNIFDDFLMYNIRHDCKFRRESLFVDSKNIHLNRFGMGRLASRYIQLIHNTFNPLGY